MAYGSILGKSSTTWTNEQILSSDTASMFGFGPSAVPNDMFNVLTHAGDLYVWRRTIVSGGDPSGYELGEIFQGDYVLTGYGTEDSPPIIYYSDSVTVSDNGAVLLQNETSYRTLDSNTVSNFLEPVLRGKFFRIIKSYSGNATDFTVGKVFFCPTDAAFSYFSSGSPYVTISKYQQVVGYPAVPPGTYIDYPVSVNPNAYQTGSDAKPAGYTLGAVQSGLFQISPNVTVADGGSDWLIAETVSVSEDGSLTLVSPREQRVIGTATVEDMATLFIGKFVSFKGVTLPTAEYPSVFSKDTIYYFPPEASLSKSGYALYVNKYQTVTGYPAIPAGTTIEYMGQVGDKARIVTGSYVGTGTYGSGNKNSIDVPEVPKLAIIGFAGIQFTIYIADWEYGSLSVDTDFSNIFSYSDGKLSWYSTTPRPEYQFNSLGTTYKYIMFF